MAYSYALQNTSPFQRSSRQDVDVIGNVLVKPRRMAKITVGMYESTMPLPTLRLEMHPDISECIEAELVRFDKGDHYTLVYQFQNFGDVTCRVTVVNE